MLTPEKRALVNFIVCRCGSERADKKRKQARHSFHREDCQNSRSLCRFYSRSTRYEREIQPLPEDTPALSTLPLPSLSLEFFEKLRDNRPLAACLVHTKHMASKRDDEGERLLPHGGPTWLSVVRVTTRVGKDGKCISPALYTVYIEFFEGTGLRLIKTIPGKSFALGKLGGGGGEGLGIFGNGRERLGILVIGGVDRSCLGPASLGNALFPILDR